VQPPLSPEKVAVNHLLLMTKVFNQEFIREVPARLMQSALKEYMRWAMRIEDPEANCEYLCMSSHIEQRKTVPLISMGKYIGDPTALSINCEEILRADDPMLDEALEVYSRDFTNSPLADSPSDFKESFRIGRHDNQLYRYHFWAISYSSRGPVVGMKTFFTFPGAGFGGYTVFDRTIRGKGKLRELITLVERQMISDQKGASGWFIECEPHAPATEIYKWVGFSFIDLDYRQPPLAGHSPFDWANAPRLHLAYKQFGESNSRPTITPDRLLQAIEWIHRVIYRIENASRGQFYERLDHQIRKFSDELIPWI
jgi:hypothetical protein